MVQTVQRAPRVDPELERYRNLMQVPSSFEEGFSWKAFFGALFISLLMVPGAIYMGLLAGASIGPAAQWVTVILFIEVARRAQQSLKNAEIYILFYMAGMLVGASPFSGLLWNQFYARSQAAQANGITPLLPTWFAPRQDSPSYSDRTFFHPDWFPVIGLVIFQSLFGSLASMILGYGLFRITSDVEKLPFPMAPVGAQGILALAEDTGDRGNEDSAGAWRWRVFSIGGAIGLGFGALYLLVPVVTGALTNSPIQLWTIPFTDTTAKTQDLLPAVATGLCFDLGNVLIGMVIPFFSVVGAFCGLIFTFIANPLLFKYGVLHQWKQGDTTIPTQFYNNVDFYLSFGIGLSLAVAAVGFYQVVKGIQERKRQAAAPGERPVGPLITPQGRGDIKPGLIIVTYFLVTVTYITVSMCLIGWGERNLGIFGDKLGVFLVLIFFGFIYTPLISYVSARLEGMVGAQVEIPYIREASFILSQYKGVAIWFLPVPQANYGQMTGFYRTAELTGTKFGSVWKTQIILYPLILIFSLFFMNFIWHMADVPSAVYPFANKMWDLNAANISIMYTATMGEFSMFQQAFKPIYLGIGFLAGLGLFGTLSFLQLPIFLFYGFVGGMSNSLMHFIVPQFIGALVGRFYFQKKLGDRWLQFVPVLLAGYSCGAGLITVLGVGITFMSKAIVQLPF